MAEAGRGAGADGWRTPMLLALVAQALFTWRLGTPATMVFDEIHYVPAARALIELSGPVNIEHPLFGKTLIAAAEREAVKLFVVAREGGVTVEELKAYCKENFTGYKVPKHIVLKDALPMTPVGKILRRELRETA